MIGPDKSDSSQQEIEEADQNDDKIEKLRYFFFFLAILPISHPSTFSPSLSRSVRKYATAGHTSELLSLATDLDPSFPSWAPLLYFDLKQCEYVDCINSRDFTKAMDIIRGCLGKLIFERQAAEGKKTNFLSFFSVFYSAHVARAPRACTEGTRVGHIDGVQ